MKRVLLIGGGGTLGTYTASELLKLGLRADVLCPEEKESDDKRLTFIRGYGTPETLAELFSGRRYDGIINFIHYRKPEEYKTVHPLLSENTDHLIFLSSYRVYSGIQVPVTEECPLLTDVYDDKELLENDDYGVSKCKAEKYLKDESGTCNWTIVRPVISFSSRRLDLITVSGHTILEQTSRGEAILLPVQAKSLTAGLDWAYNSGKLIAHLLFAEGTRREAYTVSTAQNLLWSEVADLYAELTGARFEWVETEEYVKYLDNLGCYPNPWALYCDRLFDRRIDNGKIIKATGLGGGDFASVEEGLRTEIQNIREGRII